MGVSDIVSHEFGEESESVIAYWTEDAMRSAVPIDRPTVDFDLRQFDEKGNGAKSLARSGPGHEIAGVAPSRGSADHELVPSVVPLIPDRPDTTRVPANLYDHFPWCAVGKLFIVFGGQNTVGSAWAVGGTKSGIFTAAHCIYKPGFGFASKVMFQAQYRDGRNAGSWVLKKGFIPKAYASGHVVQADMGACLAHNPVVPTIGGLGSLYDEAVNQGYYNAIGYPVRPLPGYDFNGQYMWQSVGAYKGEFANGGVIVAYNNLTGGSSGGPWIVYKQGIPYVNGVTSSGDMDDLDVSFSPYFGTLYFDLFNEIKGK